MSPPSGTHSAYLHTHRFPCARSSPGRPVPLVSVSPLAARTPRTRHRIIRVARVRAPSAENRSSVQKHPVSRSSSCVLYPRHTTHIRAPAFSFTPAITIAPYRSRTLRVCVFLITISRDHGALELGTRYLISSSLLISVSSIILEYDNPRSEPQEPWHRRQKPGRLKVARSHLCSAFLYSLTSPIAQKARPVLEERFPFLT